MGGLGDLLTALPGLALLRDARPTSRFTLICREDYGLFLKKCGLTEDVVSADSPLLTGLFGDREPETLGLESWLARFSEAWGWMNGESGDALARSLAGYGVRKIRIIGPPPRSSIRPYWRHFLRETASAVGRPLLQEETSGMLHRLRACLGANDGMPTEPFAPVVIHPGSGGRGKCWPLERFLEIASRLSVRGTAGFLVTGEAEERMEPLLTRFRFPAGWTWMRRPPLRLLAEHLGRCLFYLGNDSGVTHLAAACGSAVLAIFKKENAVSWEPCGKAEVLSADNVEDVALEVVWEKVLRWKPAHD